MNTIQRLSKLRSIMDQKKISAYIVSGSDAHLSEYLPDHWKGREMISGFTGSYGWVVITQKHAALWTDSRYFIQANTELDGTGISLEKARVPNEVSIEDWIETHLPDRGTVAFDGKCFSVADAQTMISAIRNKGFDCETSYDLLDLIWDDRPVLPQNKIFDHPIQFSGLSRTKKISLLQSTMLESQSERMVISTLDDLAWILNLRGSDIECNPVFVAYGILCQDAFTLYASVESVSEELQKELKNDGIELRSYEQYWVDISKIEGKHVALDFAHNNFETYQKLQKKNTIQAVELPSIPLKSVKNQTEIENFKKAMVDDGVALFNFYEWLIEATSSTKITEYDVALKLAEFRSQSETYKGDSFFPIVGYAGHGAIVHWHVNRDEALEIEPKNLLLIDSGGQYQTGTTDITRTFAMGPCTDEQKRNFTAVLKGMIGITTLQFPEQTSACHIDIMARQHLWKLGLNYGHGTSHGIGSFLNVHEGPISIRQNLDPKCLQPGMVLSNEPGYYEEDGYGIRIENAILCVEKETTAYGRFLGFETLTLFPIDQQLIQVSDLTKDDIEWLNNYHQKVYTELSVHLTEKQNERLKTMTSPIIKS